MPGLCLAQSPPPVDLEVGSGWDQADPRASQPRHKDAHELAKKAGAYALRVRYVQVEGRWATRVPLPIATGDVLTPQKIFDAMEALEAAITADSIYGYGLRSKGQVGVLYIIDDANLYSVKPLLMFDAAGMTDSRASSADTWFAAGSQDSRTPALEPGAGRPPRAFGHARRADKDTHDGQPVPCFSATLPDPPRLDPASFEDYTPGTFRVGDVPIALEQEALT